MNNYKGTRYIGNKRQRNKHGYCKVYDKKNQLKEVKKEEVAGELTRVEITYRTYPRFPIDELIHHPPKFNRLYTCNVVPDISNLW
ncbi:hypothetical protein [Anaerovorax odorimutans]|uniref:hypothetical protein n=1 Tax=Anaerovorax odorimutans TaxID=109327 RepID=UPI0004239372|nr:hypothetical protein [Anaerovorax odorimutans]